jgi:hypothetical protein
MAILVSTNRFSKVSSPSGIPQGPIVGSRLDLLIAPLSSRTATNPPIPSSLPPSSKTRALVVIARASLPASGSVMQIAGCRQR